MNETLISYSPHIVLGATIITALAMVVLVLVTWRYAKATKNMADMMYKQFIYEHRPYVSVKYYLQEQMTPLLEFKNHSEKNRINVRYDILLIPPDKASNMIELQKPETLEKSKLILSGEVNINPGESQSMVFGFTDTLTEMKVDINKNYMYGIVVKGHYTPDIPDVGSFPILEYWLVAVSPKHEVLTIMPLNFKILNAGLSDFI